jgi:hypothetical protein
MAQIQEEFYHGWLIQIAQAQLGYKFHCWTRERPANVTDAQPYATAEAALQAGQLRADLESARLALVDFLHGKRQFLLLHPDERSALESSITHYIERAKHPN